MLFDPGSIEAIQDAVPESLIDPFVHITDIGDPLFVVLVVAIVYLFIDNQRGGFVIGMTFAGYGVTVALKELMAIPRPPEELQIISASGYGVPSGHALGTIILFGVLAAELDVGTRSLRYVVATVLVALVSFSRIVLGVHYIEDVVAGLAIGLVMLLAVYRYEFRNPTALFAVGVVGSTVSMAVSQLGYANAVVLFGFSIAGLVAWPLITPLPKPPRRVAIATGVVTLPIATVIMPLGPTVYLSTVTVIPFAVIALLLILVTPLLADRIDRVTSTRRETAGSSTN